MHICNEEAPYEGVVRKLCHQALPLLGDFVEFCNQQELTFAAQLGDFIEDKKVINPSEAIINLNLAEQTRRVLATLTPREEKVLRMRFGIGEESDHTLEEVGQDFNVTRERIRQIEAKALRKLRHPSRSKRLKNFMDGSDH